MNQKYKKLIFLGMAIVHCACSSPKAVEPSQPIKPSIVPSPASPQTQSTEKKEKGLDREPNLKNEKSITVSISRIEGGKKVVTGNGVIIAHKDKILYILTAQHSIGVKPDDDTAPITITTDRRDFLIKSSDFDSIVKEFSTRDLAVLSLKDDSTERNQNELAHLNETVQANTEAYLFGYLPCPQTSSNRRQQLSKGKIARFQEEGSGDSFKDVHYDMNTVKRLSGSPVFNGNGNLIAIHTQGGEDKSDYDSNKCDPLPLDPDAKYTGNSGISIHEFLNLKQEWPPGLENAIQIVPAKNNKSDAKSNKSDAVTPTPSSSGVKPSDENCGVLRGEGEHCSRNEK